MKREMDLVRLQLLRVEGEEAVPELDHYKEEQKVYHMALCIEAGLVDGVIVPNEIGYPAATSATRLTWRGHEFLDAARNNRLWKKALAQLKKAGGHVTIAAMEEVLKHLAKQSLGPP